ncbi:MAG: DUF2837 family protein [Verrucomicrobiae bacterium]|nr:DUF2837 family protein [Verrucomicrobiae bacterium]
MSYAVRIAGVRTGGLAFALSLFNLLVLFSRSSNPILAPLLSKRTEQAITAADGMLAATSDFRRLFGATAAGTLAAGLMISTFQRIVTVAVNRFSAKPSMVSLLLNTLSPRIWIFYARQISTPASGNWGPIRKK